MDPAGRLDVVAADAGQPVDAVDGGADDAIEDVVEVDGVSVDVGLYAVGHDHEAGVGVVGAHRPANVRQVMSAAAASGDALQSHSRTSQRPRDDLAHVLRLELRAGRDEDARRPVGRFVADVLAAVGQPAQLAEGAVE